MCKNTSLLQDTCAKTAGMVSRFCKEMGWEDLSGLLARLQGTAL